MLPFKVVLNDSVPLNQFGTLGRVVIIDEFSYRIETINDDESIKKTTHNFGEKINTVFGEFHIELTSNDFKSQAPVLVRFSQGKTFCFS
mgnify:CR=1 FL=1